MFRVRGRDVNIPDQNGRTALHVAVYDKKVETVELLLQAGADVSMEDEDGFTPLQLLKALTSIEKIDKWSSQSSNKSFESHSEVYKQLLEKLEYASLKKSTPSSILGKKNKNHI